MLLVKVIMKLLASLRDFKLANLSSAKESATQSGQEAGWGHSLPGHSGEEGTIPS